MVAAIFKKNTLEKTQFSLNEYGFSYCGLNYSFEDVVGILIYRQVLETKVVLVGSDFDHSISTVFNMRSGERVQLTEQPTWLGSSRLEKVEKIQKIFEVVAAKTFQSRVSKFVSQIQAKGFYEYAGWRFFPSHKKIVNFQTKHAYSTQTAKFSKSYGFVQVEGESDSVGDKIARRFKGAVGIGTLSDTDVFFALFKHYFGIAWQ